MKPLAFKFQWVDKDGDTVGLRSKKGNFDGATLVLDDVHLPVAAISGLRRYDKRFVVTTVSDEGDIGAAVFQVNSNVVVTLKRDLDIARSRAWAKAERERLEGEGLGGTFRARDCRYCGATIVLTNFPDGPQLYCPFCETLQAADDLAETPFKEQEYRLCDECGMYSRPRRFTIFYFYFLLVLYGWHARQVWRCGGCMRGDAWKMLFGNALFVIGVPVALTQMMRAYGSSVSKGVMAGIDTANLYVKNGQLDRGIAIYGRILKNAPANAGIKYNLGRALILSQRIDEAAEAFELALRDSPNYEPAGYQLADCYRFLGRDENLRELQQRFNIADSADQPAAE